MALIDLANPSRFLALVGRALPWLALATAIAFAIGIVLVLMAPDDYQQGATVKIMFVHVPAAWLASLIWVVMSIAALGTLVWRHPLADVAAKTAAPIGAAFTFLCLFAGSMWGRPTRAGRAAAILTLVGAINLPIIKFSVDWWNTLHQGTSVFRLDGPSIYPTILAPLLVMALAFTLLFVTLHLAAMRNEILRRRVRTLRLLQAHGA
jgi:heme exporter protein C